MKPYRVFDHTADLGVEVFGKTEKDLFMNAAFAVYDLMADLQTVERKTIRRIAVEGSDREDLLVNYLREVLYLFNGEKILLKSFSIDEIDDRHLTGKAEGEVFNPAKHRIKREIKAVTYHRTEVKEKPGGWYGRVIFDV
jgi:SHS2 domain-containing protein